MDMKSLAILMDSDGDSDDNYCDATSEYCANCDVGSILELFATNVTILRSRRLRYGRLWKKARYNSFWENELQQNSDYFFKENLRIPRSSFGKLCEKLQHMRKGDSRFRESIPLQKRLAIALYALGSSAEYRTVANVFGVGKSTVGNLLIDFCEQVWETLQPQYLNSYPLQSEKISECVKGFDEMGMPQCLGAIDGCHIEVKPPRDDAADYYNFKGWYSTILFTAVDYRYRFLYINVGAPGRCNDSSLFEQSSLKKFHESSGLLREKSAEMDGVNIPVYLIGDSAFRLSDLVLKPYPFSLTRNDDQKLFNYTLSKCRRVVENAFGHLKARFRRIGKGLDNSIKHAPLIIKTCCVLHNFLNEERDSVPSYWVDLQREYEANNNRVQPEQVIAADTSINGQRIREAVARYLGGGAAAANSSLDAVGGVDSVLESDTS